MDSNIVNKMIEEYVGYVYGCDSHMLPAEDDFFAEMIERHHCGYEEAQAVKRRIKELELGYFSESDLSLSPLGILMYEQCGNSVERFIRRDQERINAETTLPVKQLANIKTSSIRSWIAIIISALALIVSIVSIFIKH